MQMHGISLFSHFPFLDIAIIPVDICKLLERITSSKEHNFFHISSLKNFLFCPAAQRKT